MNCKHGEKDMPEKKLLDCTLRDGGYLNDWKFGNDNIINIFERLVSAGIDIVETGFLDDRREADSDRTIFPNTKIINQTYGKLSKGNSMIVGMIDYGTCGIENIQPCAECFLDGIRVIFKKQRMREAIAFCGQVKALGYQTFVQAVSITSYNDEELAELIELVNDLEPYAFSLVDTYGLLHKGQLIHYFVFACGHLKQSIGIGYHAHNNYQLAYANCIELLQNPPTDRLLIVDGSLYGMGKSAGNTPIELLATYMNDYFGKHYRCNQLLEAIEVTILEIRKQTSWGYSFQYFLSASHDCHPNYVNYLTKLGKLSVKSVSEILDQIMPEKKLLYDEEHIRQLYFDYQKKYCDDSATYSALTSDLMNKNVLLLGPGKNIYKERDRVEQYIREKQPIVIAINYIPRDYEVDYVFMSNAKRYVQLSSALNEQHIKSKLIATSNITKTAGEFDYTLNYSKLLNEDALMPDNPMFMLLRLLSALKVAAVGLAGFDGYQAAVVQNYANSKLEYIMDAKQAEEINRDADREIQILKDQIDMEFVTTTLYTVDVKKED